MAQDGQNYERYSIENWFATGNISSPLTGQTFVTPRLYPNYCLREQLTQWKWKMLVVTASPTSVKKRKDCAP